MHLSLAFRSVCLASLALGTLLVITAGAQPPGSYEEAMARGYGDGEMSMEEMMGPSDDDPDYNGDYGDYGGYGGGSRRGGDSAASVLQDSVSNMFSGLFSSGGLASITGPSAVPQTAKGPVLEREARIAYANGDFPLALNLYYGHIVAEFEHAESAVRMAKFSRLMKRPAWQLRWGISYAKRGDATDPQPIEEGASNNNRFGPGGGGGGEFDDGSMEEMMEMEMMEMEMSGGFSGPPGAGRGRPGAGRGQSPQGSMRFAEQMAGQMAQQMAGQVTGQMQGMMQGMMDGMDDGEMGMEMDMAMEEMMMSGGGMPGGFGMGGRRRPGDAPAGPPSPLQRLMSMQRSMVSPEGTSELSELLGMVVTVMGEEFDSRFTEGDYGRALTDISPDVPMEAVSVELVDTLDSAGEPIPLWRPGVHFLGDGDSSKHVSLARKANVDLLLHFDVLLKATRGDFVQNICRCRLIHVPSGKSIGVSKPIDSLEFAQKSRTRGTSARDYVTEQLSNLFAIIDREARTMDMPLLTPEIAKKRVGSLLASGGGKNLRTLAEVRLYQSQKLLSEEEVRTAFDIVGGQEALELIYGSEEERLKIVRKWAAEDSVRIGGAGSES